MTARPARWSPRALLLARFGASLALSLLAVGNALVAAAALTGGGRAAGPLTPAAVVAGVGLAALAALQYAASRILRRRPGSAVVRAAIVATAAGAVAAGVAVPARAAGGPALALAGLAVAVLVAWTRRVHAAAVAGQTPGPAR